MSWFEVLHLKCDQCGEETINNYEFPTVIEPKVTVLRKRAEKYGWELDRRADGKYVDRCPTCVNTIEEL